MARKDTGKVVSIALAISVFVGAWLAFEYLDEQDLHARRKVAAAKSTEPGIASTGKVVELEPQLAPKPNEFQPTHPQADSLEPVSLQPAPAPITRAERIAPAGKAFKCVIGGKTVYSDTRCAGEGSTQIDITPTSGGLSPERAYTQQLADHEAREAQTRQVAVSHPEQPAAPGRDARCKALADAITYYDAMLRQPHDPGSGNAWTQARRKANDERFSLQCGSGR
jgi:hypothetical protein